MALSLNSIPELSDRSPRTPEGQLHPPLDSGPSSRTVVSRRVLLRAISVGGAAIGLSFLEALPPMSLARRAHATDLTPSTLQTSCTSISYSGTPNCSYCSTCCSLIGSSYCGSDNWHKHHQEGSTSYVLRTTSCNGNNAWIWTENVCCSSRFGRKHRCSDGKQKIDTFPWQTTVCRYQTYGGGTCPN